MRSVRSALLAVGFTAALFVAVQSQGCGSSDGGSGAGDVLVTGNVSAVTEPPVASAPASSRFFAFWKLFGASQAVAQACTAEDIFICLQTSDDIECSAVDESTCLFSVDIDVDPLLTVFFVKDQDNDNSPEEGEADADLTNELGEICAGLTITLNDVAIDFDAGTAVAATVDRDPENCPTPTATPGGDNTPTPTPEPTATPTATPTEVPA